MLQPLENRSPYLSDFCKMSLCLRHPQHLYGHMLFAGEMIFLWLLNIPDLAFYLNLMAMFRSTEAGSISFRTEVVSLEIKVVSGD